MPEESSDWQRARSPEQKEERRTSILKAAAKLLDADGIDGTGINAIAREAGLSKPNLYRYFESREAILLDLLLNEHRKWVRAFSKKLKPLAGSSDTHAIADAFAASMSGRKRYCILVGALATVLEHNVGFDTVLDFKTELNEANNEVVADFQQAVPDLDEARASLTLATLLMAAAGIWPHCHPAPVVKEVLRRPEFESFRFDFESMIRECAAALLRGMAE